METRACSGSARLPPPFSREVNTPVIGNEIPSQANSRWTSLEIHRNGHLIPNRENLQLLQKGRGTNTAKGFQKDQQTSSKIGKLQRVISLNIRKE